MIYAVVRISEIYLQPGVCTFATEYLCSNSIIEEADDFDGWHLSERIEERADFETKADAEQAISHFGDDYLAIVPVAERPLSPAAIKSAEWLANQLAAAAAA